MYHSLRAVLLLLHTETQAVQWTLSNYSRRICDGNGAPNAYRMWVGCFWLKQIHSSVQVSQCGESWTLLTSLCHNFLYCKSNKTCLAYETNSIVFRAFSTDFTRHIKLNLIYQCFVWPRAHQKQNKRQQRWDLLGDLIAPISCSSWANLVATEDFAAEAQEKLRVRRVHFQDDTWDIIYTHKSPSTQNNDLCRHTNSETLPWIRIMTAFSTKPACRIFRYQNHTNTRSQWQRGLLGNFFPRSEFILPNGRFLLNNRDEDHTLPRIWMTNGMRFIRSWLQFVNKQQLERLIVYLLDYSL